MEVNYPPTLQKFFLLMMLHDAESYARVRNIFNPENFDKSLSAPAAFIQSHADEYSTMPTLEQLNAAFPQSKFEMINDINESHYDWFYDMFEKFTQNKELERAIITSFDLLQKDNPGPVEKLIKDAVQISLTKDLGIEYWDDPRARLMALKDGNGQISTGWKSLDRKLFGGFNRGELNIFAGGSGSGKSIFLQNLSINWALAGLNGAFITLELSEGLCAMRLDSMISNIPAKDIFKDLDNLELKIGISRKQAGSLRIKFLPAQSDINDIRSYLKELEIKSNKKIDFICVDYLDLMKPASEKISSSEFFAKDKLVSEELRNLAKEFNFLLVTASQLNRSAVEEVDFDHSHIAGGLSKIQTADNVIGILTSRAMRERGEYQIQFLKTRNSSGVGQKVDLKFDESLRIHDLSGEEEESQSSFNTTPQKTSEVMSEIKSATPAAEPEKKIKADVQTNKLNEMLNDLKSGQK